MPQVVTVTRVPNEAQAAADALNYIAAFREQPRTHWTFTQGFLVGQLSVVILAIVFVKFFIFGQNEGSPDRKAGNMHTTSAILRRQRQLKKKRSTVLRNPPPLTNTTILAKTYYNVDTHQPESLDWFNVLIAQTIAQFREDARTDDALLTSLDETMNGPQKPDFLDYIKITEVNLGDEFPILSNCRISPNAEEDGLQGRLQAQIDVDLRDSITLGLETKFLLNYPRKVMATLPIALAVSIVRFSATLNISLVPNHGSEPPHSTALIFSFAPEFRLQFAIRSLLGSRSRLQDVPKIAQIVESRLRLWFVERCVEPRFQQIMLPSFWPRSSRTRDPSSPALRRPSESGLRHRPPSGASHA